MNNNLNNLLSELSQCILDSSYGFIIDYWCPLNFKMTRFSYPQRPSIGVADFFLEK